jgi:hypothetical protein
LSASSSVSNSFSSAMAHSVAEQEEQRKSKNCLSKRASNTKCVKCERVSEVSLSEMRCSTLRSEKVRMSE